MGYDRHALQDIGLVSLYQLGDAFHLIGLYINQHKVRLIALHGRGQVLQQSGLQQGTTWRSGRSQALEQEPAWSSGCLAGKIRETLAGNVTPTLGKKSPGAVHDQASHE